MQGRDDVTLRQWTLCALASLNLFCLRLFILIEFCNELGSIAHAIATCTVHECLLCRCGDACVWRGRSWRRTGSDKRRRRLRRRDCRRPRKPTGLLYTPSCASILLTPIEAHINSGVVVLFQGGDGQQRRERGGAGDGLHDDDVNLDDDTGGGDDVRRRESVAARHRHEERGELHFSHCACACARFT